MLVSGNTAVQHPAEQQEIQCPSSSASPLSLQKPAEEKRNTAINTRKSNLINLIVNVILACFCIFFKAIRLTATIFEPVLAKSVPLAD
jgi:hypothetical protein